MNAEAYCGKCGARLGWPEDIDDSAEVRCDRCGESAGTFGGLRADAEATLAKKIEGMFNGTAKQDD
jgi:hypothetical protein